MPNEEAHFTQQDRETLTTLKVKMDNVSDNISELKDDIKDLKSNFASKEEVADHEARLRRLEFWGGLAIGGLFVVQFFIGVYLALRK